MTKVAITESYLEDIADAIRSKTGVSGATYYPSEMADAIMTISGSGGITPTGTISITENGTYNVTSYASASVSVPTGSTINNQDKTVNPTTSQQSITYDSGYTGLGTVTVNAMPSGTAGTPTATKGTVSNHAISVTPSVTNTTGYITGSTKTGTAVTVSANELVSGNKAISSNGTNIDVTNYATVSVSVDGGSSTDFVVTLTYDSQDEIWKPDCTFAQVSAAYSAGKVLLLNDFYDEGNIEYYGNLYVDSDNPLLIIANVAYWDLDNDCLMGDEYFWDDNDGWRLDYRHQIITPNFESITRTYTPTTSTQTETITYNPSDYNGIDHISVTVNPMPIMTLPTSATSSAVSGYTSKATISRSTSDQYINIPTGYNSAGAYYKINAVANGSATAPSTISGTSATITTGTNTLTLTKTVSVTPTVSAGYISSGTATNSSVSLTASVTTKAAATITPGTTNQTIASGTYLTGTQTIAGDADLVASNIVNGVQIFGVTGNVVLQNYYTGSSAPSSSTGSNGDLYLQS